ncbi:hypothetical protein P8C59_000386 [Phyllachora maydis]|uniref:Transcription factor CBF/NF-Y/archaeal histone domain-containing protein n=1 Tax=Phyllachora maydis TaxID=1825666 RepID=A0AAD9HW66_9PEZI|nr:hypothetical protein P8C59_000386 [Phyllachora maydis]
MSRDTYAPKSPDLSSFYPAREPGPPFYQYTPPAHAQQQALVAQEPQAYLPNQQQPQQQQHSLPAASSPGARRRRSSSSSSSSAIVAAQPPSSLPSPGGTTTMPPKKAAAAELTPEVDPSPVRTKFPTARIKRIMQADEEVGKVAQQTPIAVGKALEMFMIAMVTKSAEVAREKSSKRVSAQMLKQVVESDDQWDFLREIVGKVENEDKVAAKSGAAAKSKAESSSEDEAPAEKKRGRPGRKKKTA